MMRTFYSSFCQRWSCQKKLIESWITVIGKKKTTNDSILKHFLHVNKVQKGYIHRLVYYMYLSYEAKPWTSWNDHISPLKQYPEHSNCKPSLDYRHSFFASGTSANAKVPEYRWNRLLRGCLSRVSPLLAGGYRVDLGCWEDGYAY